MPNPSCPPTTPLVPRTAQIVERHQETDDIFTLRLRFCDALIHDCYNFIPGQFNMLALPGVGEVPISIVSDPEDDHLFDHTIRAVGRVTQAMARLQPGDYLGVRGPFGTGWPMEELCCGHDVVVVTGGLGCAPVVSAINYILRRRSHFGRFTILQGVRHSADLIWRAQYEKWQALDGVEVFLAASHGSPIWPFHVGHVPDLFS